jgi:hypothetical protein
MKDTRSQTSQAGVGSRATWVDALPLPMYRSVAHTGSRSVPKALKFR